MNRTRSDLVYKNSIERISAYRNQLHNPKVQLEKAVNTLPIAVRYITEDNTHFVEHYPFQATVTFSDQRRKPYITEAQQIKIWIPWTLMKINLQNNSYQYMYAAGQSLMSMEDNYFVGPFPNTYAEGNICWSNSLTPYDGMTFDYDINGYGVDLKTFYSIAFNEYFSGGWNTDLGSMLANMLHYQYSAFYRNIESLPMIHRLMCPTAEYVNERLPQLTAARRRMMSGGLSSLMQSRLKSTAYVLYMLSTFTLEETLQFWNEITSLKNTHNIGTSSIQKFSDIAIPRPYPSHHSSFSIDGVEWGNISSTVSQRDPLLTSEMQNSISNRFMYTYMYNFPPGSNDTSVNSLRSFSTAVAEGHLFYTRELQNEMYADFVETGLNDLLHHHLYMVNIADHSWAKIVVPNSEMPHSTTISSQQRIDTGMLHHAFLAQHNIVSEDTLS